MPCYDSASGTAGVAGDAVVDGCDSAADVVVGGFAARAAVLLHAVLWLVIEEGCRLGRSICTVGEPVDAAERGMWHDGLRPLNDGPVVKAG